MTAWPRVVGAVLLVVIALVHLNLYLREYYRQIPTVGWLFLLTVISAVALAAALFVRPGPVTALAASGFALSVLGGYLLTLWLPNGLFQFKEPGVSYSGVISIVAEVATAVVLAGSVLRHQHHTPSLRSAPVLTSR
jgi:hypothetical protein